MNNATILANPMTAWAHGARCSALSAARVPFARVARPFHASARAFVPDPIAPRWHIYNQKGGKSCL